LTEGTDTILESFPVNWKTTVRLKMAWFTVVSHLWIPSALKKRWCNSVNVNPLLGAVRSTAGKGDDKVYSQESPKDCHVKLPFYDSVIPQYRHAGWKYVFIIRLSSPTSLSAYICFSNAFLLLYMQLA